jgi:DNA-binding MarR family transcriptional regulator
MSRTAPAFDLVTCARIGANCTMFNLRKASRVATQLADEVFRDAGIRGTQFGLLAGIYWSGTATLTQLARSLAMDRTTLTRNLSLLRRQGLVATTRASDRRARAVALTPRGRRALSRALPYWEKAQSRIVRRLGVKEWRKLMHGLRAIVRLGAAS